MGASLKDFGGATSYGMEPKNIKLLLAEDNALIRDLYENAFRLMGYSIEIAIDGQDAVDKLEQMSPVPDLVLLDILMPKMNGYDVLHYIKNSEKLKNILVVMLTSLGDDEAAEKTLSLGASAFFVKDEHEPSEIAQKVEDIIAKSRTVK